MDPLPAPFAAPALLAAISLPAGTALAAPLPAVPLLPAVTLPAVTVPTAALVTVLLAGAAGGLAGALTRRWLARLRRGVAVDPPWCEAGLAVLWAVLGVLAARWVPLLAVLCWLGVAGAATDLLRRRLPDALTLPALPVVLAALVPAGPAAVLRGVAGAVLLAGVYAAVHLVSPVAMGAGDVKLAAPVGAAVTGGAWAGLPVAAVLAAVLSAVVAAGALLAGRARWGSGLPHGPVLLGSALVVVTAGATG
ncbi:leader peptidase (prepilin peptidase) / N-methyltransferase [Pseudonocardia ammonioxydans]|uniref:Leader peptidase (Prepilin peptidase) / N-methyltransferase n=1 Tax=Pseudonocardia ammonioxydans TaxID=260086 RepID=A0A1I5ABU3_PSUAM|nr:A24 family peptidase [Pseudonocardia ammonioxydans]SFN59892.1 leader peptidase (prepilin peptidase) / N-methyltransferase [Pseudonocardia ammonioxydans]